MAEFVPCCLKRKDRGDPLPYFSDISLSSPAIKIRRMDYFVPKGEDGLKQHSLEETNAAESVAQGASAIMCSENNIGEESALVLYKSTNTPLCKSLSSSDFPIVLNSNLIPQLKEILKLIEDGKCGRSRNNESTRDSLAVIPWVESQLPSGCGLEESTTSCPSELMEPKDTEMMEAEDRGGSVGGASRQMFELGGLVGGLEGFQYCQQQQQHCTPPQLLQSNSSQLAWSW